MSQKIATVLGATGNQGSGVIKALLQNPEYNIRAVTRNRNSDAAKHLEATDIEVVEADAADEASLKLAFDGSHLIFAITDYVAPYRAHGGATAMRTEIQQGSNIVRAAQATSTLEHFIWSTLPSIFDVSDGRYHATNFDGKAEVDKLIRSDISLLSKTTFLMVGWYDSNLSLPVFTPFWAPHANQYIVVGDYPADAMLPSIGRVNENIVPFIKAIVDQANKTRGAVVAAYIEKVAFEDGLKRWAKAQGKEATYIKTDIQTVYKLWPGWADLANMTRFIGAYKEGFWSMRDDEILTAADLGIDSSEFVPLDESYRSLHF